MSQRKPDRRPRFPRTFTNLRCLAGKSWLLQDQISSDTYERDGNELRSQGLFVDLRPWRASVFA